MRRFFVVREMKPQEVDKDTFEGQVTNPTSVQVLDDIPLARNIILPLNLIGPANVWFAEKNVLVVIHTVAVKAVRANHKCKCEQCRCKH